MRGSSRNRRYSIFTIKITVNQSYSGEVVVAVAVAFLLLL